MIAAHQTLLQQFPNLLLILIPRHPKHFPNTINLIHQTKLNYITHSSKKIPSTNTQIIINDTINELILLYNITDLAFINDSLIKHKKHNPLKTTAHTIPILIKPHTFNFKNIYTQLKQTNELITVTDTTTLTKKISSLLTDTDYRNFYNHHTVKILYQNQNTLQHLLQLLKPYLPPKTH